MTSFDFIAFSVPKYAFEQSGFFGQLIVILLFCISIYVWTVMFEKYSVLKKAWKANLRFQKKFKEAVSILDLAISNEPICPLKSVYASGINKLMFLCEASPEVAESYCRSRKLPRELNPMEIEFVISAADNTAASEGLNLEERIGNLATIVSVSPFFGLLGTVWGVMSAFCGMAVKGAADIGTLAPGVSGALLTTVVGLLVAIPSLIGYNMLTNTIRKIDVDMDNFVNEFESRLKLEAKSFVEKPAIAPVQTPAPNAFHGTI